MPHYIIKPVEDDDFYVEYSTISDTIIGCGGRADYPADRVARADETGTSAMYSTGDSFADRDKAGLWFRTEWYPEIPGQANSGHIPWGKVRAFCETFRDGAFHPTPDLVVDLDAYDEDADDFVPFEWEDRP